MIAGDLFEKEEDLTDDRIWKDAGSEVTHVLYPVLQNPNFNHGSCIQHDILAFFRQRKLILCVCKQCFGSVSGSDPDSIGLVDSYPDPKSGPEFRRAKRSHKNGKKLRNSMF